MEQHLTFQQKYRIILNKDTSYEGIFFTAVKTTGIFCRPSCSARKPKIENIEFFNTVSDAIQNGYRPCKVCRPMEWVSDTPAYVNNIIRELNENPYLKIRDCDLRARNIEPNRIRRWFKKNHNMTFHAYQRMLRINSAFSKISRGETVTTAAYDAGFESLSGFNSSFQSIFGSSAGKSSNRNIINIIRFSTPLGPMIGCTTSGGVCLLEFSNRRMLEFELKDISKRLNAVILPGTNNLLEQLQQEITEYFQGSRTTFAVPLETPGTGFQNRVWAALQNIPYGRTISYKQQAIKLKAPNAVRAVASANGYNRIAIIIPCHRVIGSNGELTGYGGGLERKKWLLDFERTNLQGLTK